MKAKLLKRLRKDIYIKYDKISKQYQVHYPLGGYKINISTDDVNLAFEWYRYRMIIAARDLSRRGPRTKFIDVKHAVKTNLK